MRKIIIVDFFNLFIRNYSREKKLSDNGFGGIGESILSIYFYCKRFDPDCVILCYEGKNSGYRRRRSFHEYKEGRKTPHTIANSDDFEPLDSQNLFWNSLLLFQNIISNLPFLQLGVDYLEADDVISYLVRRFSKDYKIIVSTDKDYYQLINDLTVIWTPFKKENVLIDKNFIKQKYKIPPKNWLILKSFLGDISDNIVKVAPRQMGEKRILNLVPELTTIEFDDISDFVGLLMMKDRDEGRGKLRHKVLVDENFDALEKNYRLMSLIDNYNLSARNTEVIEKLLDNWKPVLNLFEFEMILRKHNVEIVDSKKMVTTAALKNAFKRLNYQSERFKKYV